MKDRSFLNSVLFKREFLGVFIAVVNAFSWYFPLYVFFENIASGLKFDFFSLSVVYGLQFVGAIGSAIVGTVLIKKFRTLNFFLSMWMLIGVIASAMMILLETADIAFIWPVSLILGLSLGLGFPSCLAYFGSYGLEETRGRLGGITFLASGLCIFFVGVLISFSSLVVGALILATWRALGLVSFLFVQPKVNDLREDAIEVSYKSILSEKPFLLYFAPWFMFSLVNFLERPITGNLFGPDIASLVPIAEFGIGGVAALVGGWFADSVGRKRVIVFAFIMLGVGYALLGLFPEEPRIWYMYIVLDGVAWGIFFLAFFMVIWSELAEKRAKEKYYLIGVLPFLISSFIQVLFAPLVSSISETAAFSLASFFLFLAVLPLMYAPETLPQKKIEQRQLRGYIEQAKKVIEKDSGKTVTKG
jgi:hypothetical protein